MALEEQKEEEENPLEEQETAFVFLLPKTITVLRQVEDCITINYYYYYYYLESRYLPLKTNRWMRETGGLPRDSETGFP